MRCEFTILSVAQLRGIGDPTNCACAHDLKLRCRHGLYAELPMWDGSSLALDNGYLRTGSDRAINGPPSWKCTLTIHKNCDTESLWGRPRITRSWLAYNILDTTQESFGLPAIYFSNGKHYIFGYSLVEDVWLVWPLLSPQAVISLVFGWLEKIYRWSFG